MKEYIVLTRLGKMAFEVDRDQIVKLSLLDPRHRLCFLFVSIWRSKKSTNILTER